jgi:hypothetical protein
MAYVKLTNVASRLVTYPIMRRPKIGWSPDYGTWDFTTKTVELKPVGFDVTETSRLIHWARLKAANMCKDEELEVLRDPPKNTAAIIIRKWEET